MKKPDLFSSLFWIALALGLIYWGYGLELGTLSEPESGFIIFWAGILMFGLAGVVLLIALLEKDRPARRKPFWTGSGWKKVIGVTAALVLYAYLFIPLGFIISAFLFLLFLFRIYEPQKLVTAIWASALMVIVTYLVFDICLGSQLPKGFLDLS